MNRVLKLEDSDNNVDFISACGNLAISAEGYLFKVGDRVSIDDPDEGVAIIEGFELDHNDASVRVHTTKGHTHISFIHKIE